MPGGDGIKLRYTQPLLLDDVAADFPSLTIIGAHPSWPWQDEMLAVAPRSLRWAVELREPSWVHEDVLTIGANRAVQSRSRPA